MTIARNTDAGSMRLALVTDAWEPQVNGVVRTYQIIVDILRKSGWSVTVFQPGDFFCVPLPGDAQIPLAVNAWPRLTRQLRELKPTYIHIATEGPLGMAARRWCAKHNYRFTTSFHTKFPEFIYERTGLPTGLSYAAARWFHNGADATLVPTASLKRDLVARGFSKCKLWAHGVDTQRFHPSRRVALKYATPILLFVGRVAIEKNIEAFLSLDVPGTKLVVGDGPQRKSLEARFPAAVFLGIKEGGELATLYASADAFVFPSRTDTFGLVLLEALASGTPIAGYPVTGPIDVANDEKVGGIDEDLGVAIAHALRCSRADCRTFAEQFSWDAAARILAESLVPRAGG